MANKLDSMDLKQILALHKDGLSNRKIALTLGVSRNTVNSYVAEFRAVKFSIDELLSFDEVKLSELFTYKTTIDTNRQNDLMLYFEKVNQARNHPGFTFQHHYFEYVSMVENPYSYTQFLEHYKRKYAKEKGSMKLEHEPGYEMFVDFAGKKLEIKDKHTGESIPVEVFVAILPNSHYTFVEACKSQKQEDFIISCRNALQFYGGVPKAIVSDNLKSAVTRSHKHEPVINRNFKEFARHYDCVINPTRTYSPQDKALVENAVNLAYQRIYYPLREMTFFSLEELNREIKKLLENYNRLLFQRKECSRLELFQSVEWEYLKPLPAAPYQMKEYRRAKVQKMGFVYFSPDKNYYSVPYRYIGKQTLIHYTPGHVEVYYNHERIALHKRNPAPGNYNTDKSHLSSTHKAYVDWNPDTFINRAARHGENVMRCVEHIFESMDYPEIGYERAMGLIQLYKAYGSNRLDKACAIALQADMVSYTRIKNILKNSMDKTSLLFLEFDEQPQSHIPKHDNIRGSSEYD